MPYRQELAARPRDGLPVRGALSRRASSRSSSTSTAASRCQSCTMACKSTWTFNKGQEHMWWANVETKPYGGYPQLLGREDPREARGGQPRRPGLGRQASRGRNGPYGTFDGQTIFEAAQRTLTPDSARVLGYLPDRRGVELAEHLRGQPGRQARRPQQAQTRPASSCRSTTPGSSTWRASATTARTPPAWPPARARRSTSGPKTASC